MTSTQQHRLAKSAILADDWLRLIELCWPEIRLYDKQAEILLSVRDNRETFVHAANEMGKDFIASLAVLCFFLTRSPAKVVTSSSSETQLKSVLWGELKQRIYTSKIPLGLRVTELSIERFLPDGKTPDPLSYVIGHVTKKEENVLGHHLPQDKPRVMAVLDEASGIPDNFYDACDTWAHRKLVIGNPLNTQTFFYKACSQGDLADPAEEEGLLRKVIHIGGDDSPNVRLGRLLEAKGVKKWPTVIPGVLSYADYKRRMATWDEFNITTRLKGHFYEGKDMILYPPAWLELANKAWKELEGMERRGPRALGVDAGAGKSLSAWTVVDALGILHTFAIPTPNTMAIAGHTLRIMREWNIPSNRVCFDNGGGGGTIADLLREKGKRVRTVSFGSAPTPTKPPKRPGEKRKAADERQMYKNRRAEMYGMLRDALDPQKHQDVLPFAIPPTEEELMQEMRPMPLLYDSEGKMYLPPKRRKPGSTDKQATIEEILGHSPDRLDSLVVALFALKTRDRVQARMVA